MPDAKEIELRDLYDKSRSVEKKRHRVVHRLKMLLRKATKRLHQREAISAKRKRNLDRHLDEKNSSGRERACAWALDQVGTHEAPGYPNTDRGGPIDRWNRAVGLTPGPYAYWCGSFVHACLKAGGIDFPDWIRYTPSIFTYAQRGEFGLSLVAAADAKPGDMVLMNFDGGVVDHVGLYIGNGQTVEGNTSPTSGGSQNNGGGVYLKAPRVLWHYVHVDYSKAPKKVKGEERH